MKNIITIIIFTFSYTLNAQEGVIVSYKTYENIQNGTYLKDIDNELNPFVGTYVTEWNDKKFKLVLQKIEHVTKTSLNGDYYYEDVMVGKYEITNLNGSSVLYSTMDITEFEGFPITDLGGVYNGELDFDFYDSEERCKNSFRLSLDNMITQSGVTTVRYYCRHNEYYEYENCPYPNKISIPLTLPVGFLTLTKTD
jgi:hypothetical protein